MVAAVLVEEVTYKGKSQTTESDCLYVSRVFLLTDYYRYLNFKSSRISYVSRRSHWYNLLMVQLSMYSRYI